MLDRLCRRSLFGAWVELSGFLTVRLFGMTIQRAHRKALRIPEGSSYLVSQSMASAAGAASAAAGFSLFGCEGRATSAGAGGVRVIDLESAAHHVVDIVD